MRFEGRGLQDAPSKARQGFWSPEPLPLKANALLTPRPKATRKCGSSTLAKDTTLVKEMSTILVGNTHHDVQGWQRGGDAKRLVLVVRS